MSVVTITVSGAGGTFGAVVRTISEALMQKGARVNVYNERDSGGYSPEHAQIQLEGRTIKIECNGTPWGG